jgi:putative peptide zinc metalloprotease protein
VFNALIKPAFKNLRHVLTAPKLRKVRRRAIGWTFGGIGALVLLLLALPLPLHTDTEGVIWLPDAAYVRARSAGFVLDVPVHRGDAVAAQDVLTRLEEPTLSARINALEWRAEEMRRRALALSVTDRAGAEVAELQRLEAMAELTRERARAAGLSIRAPQPGRFEPLMSSEALPGRYLAEGDLIGFVLPVRADIARIVVSQGDNALVRERTLQVELKLAGHLETRHLAKVLREVPSAQNALPSPVLAQSAGGQFLTDPADPEGLRVLDQIFVYDLALPDSLASASFGTRVHVRFDHGMEPAGAQIYRRLRQLLLRHFDA